MKWAGGQDGDSCGQDKDGDSRKSRLMMIVAHMAHVVAHMAHVCADEGLGIRSWSIGLRKEEGGSKINNMFT